ncbi:MAG: hypothetical protein GY922_13240 [Proteobacteria bacterium]|nr:hypothetical protein [Pseudomonadota bacterium]
MVHLQMKGFIADNLFQYAVARLLAEELGFALRISHSRMRPGYNVPYLEAFLQACADAPLAVDGAVYEGPVDYNAHEDYGEFDGYDLDLAALMANREPRRIEVCGHFQCYSVLRPHKERIRRWFAMTPDSGGYDISDEDIVLHVRRGDLLIYGLAMNPRFYTDLLQELSFRRLYIVGTGLDEEVRTLFRGYDPVYMQGSPVEDFRFMLCFRRMILSNSGFCWWAGFMSAATEIYSPQMVAEADNQHSKAQLVDLRVRDEPRFRYVEDVGYAREPYRMRDLLRAFNMLGKRRILNAFWELLSRRGFR